MITFASGILVIVLIVTWVWKARAASRLEAWLMAAIAAAAVIYTWLQSPMSVLFGPAWPGAFAALVAFGATRLRRRSMLLPSVPPNGVFTRRIIIPLVVFTAIALQIVLVTMSRVTPPDSVALTWPLRGGTFKVMHGGSSTLTNNHAGIEAQKYALDILAIDRFGLRASGIGPADLNAYVIFDTPIHAPCAGEVIAARDGMSDTAPVTERAQLAGNFAAIFCNGVTVLLAHIHSGTLAVKAGDRVDEGQLIGRVGNSGNSSEPHLHIHANRGRVADPVEMVTTAEGVPITFGGRFLVRNDVVQS